MLSSWCVGEDSWETWRLLKTLGLQDPRDLPLGSLGNQSQIFIGRTDAEAEAPILWPPHVKGQLIEKDLDAGKDRRQEEKGTTEEEMVWWHHRLNGHKFEHSPGDGKGQESLQSMGSQRVQHDWVTEQQMFYYSRPSWTGQVYYTVKESESRSAAAAKLFQSCPTLCDPVDGSPPGSPVPGIFQVRLLEWDAHCLLRKVAQFCPIQLSPGQNTGVGSLSLLQGIFPIQGSNPGLLHCRRILYRLSHKAILRKASLISLLYKDENLG